MKKSLVITFLFLSVCLCSFAQEGKPYGPVAYRTPQQTIGEDYYVSKRPYEYFHLKKIVSGVKTAVDSNTAGTILKLIDIKDNYAVLKDRDGADYTSELDNNLSMSDLIPVSEFENAKALLLNKPVWVSSPALTLGSVTKTTPSLRPARFTKLMVVKVDYGVGGDLSLEITFKAPNGNLYHSYETVSNTNTSLSRERWFSEKYFINDPEKTHPFSPLVWKQIRANETPIGMPVDAVVLVKGHPEAIHSTSDAKGTLYQYVFGKFYPSYYYFKNGKLVSKQD